MSIAAKKRKKATEPVDLWTHPKVVERQERIEQIRSHLKGLYAEAERAQEKVDIEEIAARLAAGEKVGVTRATRPSGEVSLEIDANERALKRLDADLAEVKGRVAVEIRRQHSAERLKRLARIDAALADLRDAYAALSDFEDGIARLGAGGDAFAPGSPWRSAALADVVWNAIEGWRGEFKTDGFNNDNIGQMKGMWQR